MKKLKIEGMSCEHCVRAVSEALEGVAGVATVDVNLDRGEAIVSGAADPSALIEAVEEEGYRAETVE